MDTDLSRPKAIFVAIGLVLLAILGMGVGQFAVYSLSLKNTTLRLGSMITIAQVLGLGGVSIGFIKYKYGSLSEYKFEFDLKQDVLSILGVITVLIGMSVLVTIVSGLAGVEQAENTVQSSLEMSNSNIYMFAILSLVIVGPLEELFFRGTVQRYLKDTFTETHAVAITAALFSSVHIMSMVGSDPLGFVSYLVTLFVGGFALGWAYENTQNLAVPMAGHGLYNALIALTLLA